MRRIGCLPIPTGRSARPTAKIDSANGNLGRANAEIDATNQNIGRASGKIGEANKRLKVIDQAIQKIPGLRK